MHRLSGRRSIRREVTMFRMTCQNMFRFLDHLNILVFVWAAACVITTWSRDIDSQFSYNEMINNDINELKNQMAINPYTHHKLPVLKMLKRQVRNFRTGMKANATLTLVFHVKENVDIHWFKVDMIDHEEIVYPILDDHPYYHRRLFRSGDVIAETLLIPPSSHDEVHAFETILTIREPMMQYQLKTILDSKIKYHLDNIDSPEWLVVPAHEDHIFKHSSFEKHCRVFVRRCKAGNSLMLMHAPPALAITEEKLLPQLRSLVQTHDYGMENVGEETGSLILKGTLSKLNKFKDVLDVRATQTIAQKAREGFYMCAVERQNEADSHLDKLYLLSYLTFGTDRSLSSLIPLVPRVEVLTCATDGNLLINNKLHLKEGKLGCVKCRGFGFPLPDVKIDFKQKRGIGNTTYINVAEAGVVEAIYLFKNPLSTLSGQYSCSAANEHGTQEIYLEIKVRRG